MPDPKNDMQIDRTNNWDCVKVRVTDLKVSNFLTKYVGRLQKLHRGSLDTASPLLLGGMFSCFTHLFG
jgi:hypothetical protein